MNRTNTVRNLWKDMDVRRWDGVGSYFAEGASIVWPNTGEFFAVDEFVGVNRDYPGRWAIIVEKLMEAGETVISVVRVTDGNEALHVVSFFEFALGSDKIARLEEYWGNDGPPPPWRTEKAQGNA